jgi:hypothetical protein
MLKGIIEPGTKHYHPPGLLVLKQSIFGGFLGLSYSLNLKKDHFLQTVRVKINGFWTVDLVDGLVKEDPFRSNLHVVLLIQRGNAILDNQFEGWQSHLCNGSWCVVIGVYTPIVIGLDFTFADGLMKSKSLLGVTVLTSPSLSLSLESESLRM